MNSTTDCLQDVMQVCRNGHVITDLLRTYPERGLGHCDRCGADTLVACLTCGLELPGAIPVPGLVPVGSRKPPEFCFSCGAPFPWTRRPPPPPQHSLGALEALLRRLPLVVRQLRVRHGDRPPFRVEDEHDLEDLLRAVLPLHCDDVRPENRTPPYSSRARTDFLVMPGQVAVTAKRCTPATREQQFAGQLQEDLAYYEGRGGCRVLVFFVYDPEGLLTDPRQREAAWSRTGGACEVRCVIAG